MIMRQRLAVVAVAIAVLTPFWSAWAVNYNPEVRRVDIDVDSDYNGAIEAADDGSEVTAGGIVCVGGWTNITINQTLTTTQPGDQNIASGSIIFWGRRNASRNSSTCPKRLP